LPAWGEDKCPVCSGDRSLGPARVMTGPPITDLLRGRRPRRVAEDASLGPPLPLLQTPDLSATASASATTSGHTWCAATSPGCGRACALATSRNLRPRRVRYQGGTWLHRRGAHRDVGSRLARSGASAARLPPLRAGAPRSSSGELRRCGFLPRRDHDERPGYFRTAKSRLRLSSASPKSISQGWSR
jgi:hypothetical protein